MRASLRTSSTIAVALVLAACSGGGSTTNPPATNLAASNSPASTGGAATTAGVCSQPVPGTATDVAATVADNSWGPVAAAVGDVITWTNADAVPHKVALDDGSCSMSASITGAAPQSLVFSAAGSYPFHCTVHPTMEGTIVIS